MYLRSLTMRGFKSFASTTTLKFEPGITCVVGPNGSGKSNVVDALTWVMGEQGAKSLRGANMADVIFAGTSGRPALGRAQVELTIDNSDGRLPIEYAEVTISRTLFRGGGSEYTINGAPCRLLDVQELLSDTGMGKQMHVIVGQGQLDAVLRATAEQRREFIDEAAGVLKHRKRKERALRKLGAMGADLLRVVDLSDEIRRQLRPLARQAKAAKAAEGIHARIRYAQMRLLVEAYLSAQGRLEGEQRGAAVLQEQKTRIANELAAAERELRQGEQRLQNLDRVSGSVTDLLHKYEALQERLSTVRTIARERALQAKSSPAGPSESAVTLAAEKYAETQREVDEATALMEQARADAAAAAQQTKTSEGRLAQLQRRLGEETKRQEQERERQVRGREQLLKAQGAVQSAQQALAGAQTRHKFAQAELTRAREEAAALTSDSSVQEAATHLEAQHEDAQSRAAKLQETLETQMGAQAQAEAELAKWEATAQAMREALKQEDTASNPAAAPGIPTLDQLLKVTPGWERAIAALLGNFESAPTLPEGSWEELLRAPRTGEYLVAIRQTEPALAAHGGAKARAPQTTKSVPWAEDVVEITPGARIAVAELLSGSAVASTAAEGRKILQKHPHVLRVALEDGTVMGRYTAENSQGGAPPALLLRRREQEASREAETLRLTVQKQGAEEEFTRDKLAEAVEKSAQTLSQLRAAEKELARQRQSAESGRTQVAAAAKQLEAAEAELRECERIVRVKQEQLELAENHEWLDQAAANDVAGLQGQLEQEEAASRNLREQEMKARLQVGLTEEKFRAAMRQAEAFKARFDQLRADRDEAKSREEALARRVSSLHSVADRAEVALDETRTRLQEASAWRAELLAGRRGAKDELARISREAERLRWSQVSAGEEWQQAEVALAGLEMRYEQARAELGDFLLEDEDGGGDDSPAEEEETRGLVDRLISGVVQTAGPDIPVTLSGGEEEPYVRAKMEEELRQARAQLGRLGIVNPLAVTEYESLKARHDFLQEQLTDLRKSKKDLLEIITDVDERIENAFQEAFADTKKEFEKVFPLLFPGGTGSLSLTDPDTPLTTGVEIYARPAGKRVTQMSLLSGGERSLAALAYLVAIFRARPSPFYVLDEVEAALDDINLSRVLAVLEDLREESQLIIVTHQKRTMEIADALYGVTMSRGESAVVSHRM